MSEAPPQVAVVGAGWAGLAAAVAAHEGGARVTVFEAAPHPGGRARRIVHRDAQNLDNGQHILIGAYAECLRLMRHVGVPIEQALLRRPLSLRFPGGDGLCLPDWPAPLDALAGILGARGWSWRERLALLGASLRWQLAGYRCPPGQTVQALCQGLPPRLMAELIEPLCVSALNTLPASASAEVFLRVLRDSLAGPSGGSNLLIPQVDLGALWPEAAVRWLQRQGHTVHLAQPVQALQHGHEGWQVDTSTQRFDRLILACPAWEAQRLLGRLEGLPPDQQQAVDTWCRLAAGLQHAAIATVYAQAESRSATPLRLPEPMLALRSGPQAPAQFVFDRGQLGGPKGLLAFVVSASPTADRQALQAEVLVQGMQALAACGLSTLQPLLTVLEKRATFVCSPGLQRPPTEVLPGLQACGDHVQGPYPATLEGAALSGSAAGRRVTAR